MFSAYDICRSYGALHHFLILPRAYARGYEYLAPNGAGEFNISIVSCRGATMYPQPGAKRSVAPGRQPKQSQALKGRCTTYFFQEIPKSLQIFLARKSSTSV